MERLQMEIQGMSCGHCVNTVKRALDEIAGVSVDSLSVGSAEVTYDAARTDVDAIVDAVKEAGYSAHVTASPK